jgi:hypothetical protein
MWCLGGTAIRCSPTILKDHEDAVYGSLDQL